MSDGGQAKLRLIQCGVGGHGGGWFVNSVLPSNDFELAAIVDPNAEAIAKASETAGRELRAFVDLSEAIDAVEADAVLSVTPPKVHPAHAKLAAEAKLHLLVEKPLAEDVEVARKMVDDAAKAGTMLMVGQNRRWDSEPRGIKAALDSGRVGHVDHVHIDFFRAADFRGSFRHSMPHVLLVDMAVHHIDLLRYFMGREVVRVFADEFNPKRSVDNAIYQHGAAIRMVMTLDDGSRVSYAGDWSAVGRPSSWHGDWTFQGDKGRLTFSDDRGLEVATSDGWAREVEVESLPIPELPQSQGQLLAAFAESVRTGEPGLTSGDDNLRTVAAVLAAVESCETGKPVDVRY
ncbi:MAG: Gfo/Idh/MocA family oxidoreductase [Planctomycetota bacterium]